MKMLNENKPWLDIYGKELSIEKLKIACKSWTIKTWEEYLATQECGLEGKQIPTWAFDKRSDSSRESIWDMSSGSCSDEVKEEFNTSKEKLTRKQKDVIEKYFYEGKSESRIGQELLKSQSTVHEIKSTALKRLKTSLLQNPIDLPLMSRHESDPTDLFDKIETMYWNGSLSDEEYYRLWALADMGQITLEELCDL